MGKAPSHKKDNFPTPKWAREQDRFNSKKKYPYCVGTFPDCPKDPNDNDCKICPLYKK